MSRLSGALLIAAGVGVAGYVLPRSTEVPHDAGLPERAGAATVTAPLKQSSPALAPDAVPSTAAATRNLPAVLPSAAVTPPVVPSKSNPPAAASASASRPNVYAAVTRSPSTPKAPQRTSAAAPPLDRAGLTKALLVELKRVGCYGGPIGPVWTSAARKSMKAFTEYANATLPVDQPDHILLAMVQSHAGLACGQTCAAGSTRGMDGHCRPTNPIAAKSHKHAPGAASGTAKLGVIGKARAPAEVPPVAADTSTTLPMGRMSLAGPHPAPAAVDREAESAATTLPSPSGETGKVDAGLAKQPKKQRRTHNDRRTGSWPSKFPRWVPWAQPWAMN
jgi:hypothetical protein